MAEEAAEQAVCDVSEDARMDAIAKIALCLTRTASYSEQQMLKFAALMMAMSDEESWVKHTPKTRRDIFEMWSLLHLTLSPWNAAGGSWTSFPNTTNDVVISKLNKIIKKLLTQIQTMEIIDRVLSSPVEAADWNDHRMGDTLRKSKICIFYRENGGLLDAEGRVLTIDRARGLIELVDRVYRTYSSTPPPHDLTDEESNLILACTTPLGDITF